jgi:tetratricopeptide (TPR) repeat protein
VKLWAAWLLLAAPQQVFEDAERLYNGGRYSEAAAQYESLLAEGTEDGHLYYNLGNAFFKSGRLGKAVLAYERALRLMPGDEDVRANLAFANEMIADAVSGPELPGYLAWAIDLYRGSSPDTFAALLSIAFILGGAAGSCLLLGCGARFRVPLFYFLGGLLVLAVLSGAALSGKLAPADEEQAVVLSARSEVRSGPGETNPQLAEIHEGLKLTVRSRRDDWFQVTLPNGLTGWVLEKDVEII